MTCEALMHTGLSCEEYQRQSSTTQKQEEDASAAFLKEHAKLCPRCSRKWEKNGGCDHMTCECERQAIDGSQLTPTQAPAVMNSVTCALLPTMDQKVS